MYVAARGGEAAIQRAEQLYRAMLGDLTLETVHTIQEQMPYLLDRVMGEASLYAPELAALALAQTGGDLYEAVLLLRAYRSTQPRLAYAEPISDATTLTVRRISAAFKDIPGGQVLGPTLDYSHRILHNEVLDGSQSSAESPLSEADDAQPTTDTPVSPAAFPPVAGWLRLNGLLAETATPEPCSPSDLP